MKEKIGGNLLPVSTIGNGGVTALAVPAVRDSWKGRYKFWALAAIILLTLWSMLTGAISLSSSARSLIHHDFLDLPLHHDFDVLEMEEREKVVRHMWDVYTQGQSRQGSPRRFWQEAFEAAYKDLASDDQEVRDAAISEIARMSMRMLDLEQSPSISTANDNQKNFGGGGNKSQSNGSRKGFVLASPARQR